jgi:hypothetical protein
MAADGILEILIFIMKTLLLIKVFHGFLDYLRITVGTAF